MGVYLYAVNWQNSLIQIRLIICNKKLSASLLPRVYMSVPTVDVGVDLTT